MRVIRNKDVAGTVESRVPPGAYIAKFYHDGVLTAGISGSDSHPLGARLIRVNAFLQIPSTAGNVVVGIRKNEAKFAEITILQGQPTEQLDLVGLDLVQTFTFLTEAPSLDFRAVVDTIDIEIISPGDAQKLTVHCVFDR